jgi:hypothetical protein
MKLIHEENFQSPFAIYKFFEKFREGLSLVSTPTLKAKSGVRPARLAAPRWIPPNDD